MSVELERENILFYSPLEPANVKTVVDSDIIVPDTKPDVLNILQVNAISSIQEKYIQKNRICVTGNIDYTVLYSGGDEEIEVKSINYKTPFTQQIEVDGIEEDMFNYVISNISHIESKIQNSRKINIKSVVSFETGVVDRKIVSAVTDIDSEIKIPSRKTTVKALNMVVCETESFYVSDELKFPGIPGEIEEILKNDIKIVSKEVKSMNNKLVVKGSVITDTLYSVDGDMYHMENESPFTEVIDADGLTPEMHTEIRYSLHNADFELSNQDNENYISFGGNIDILVKAYEELTYEVVKDVYCPDYSMNISESEHNIRSINDTITQTISLSEEISLNDAMPGIVKVYNLTTVPFIDDFSSSDGYATVSGLLDTRLLYLSDSQNMPVYSMSKKIPFTIRTDSASITPDSIIEADITAENSSYLLKNDRNVELRVNMKIAGKIIKNIKTHVITNITVNEEEALTKKEQPGIVIYFADDNEELWDVAKRYNTTAEEIASINNIDTESILSDRQQLIIPKRIIL